MEEIFAELGPGNRRLMEPNEDGTYTPHDWDEHVIHDSPPPLSPVGMTRTNRCRASTRGTARTAGTRL